VVGVFYSSRVFRHRSTRCLLETPLVRREFVRLRNLILSWSHEEGLMKKMPCARFSSQNGSQNFEDKNRQALHLPNYQDDAGSIVRRIVRSFSKMVRPFARLITRMKILVRLYAVYCRPDTGIFSESVCSCIFHLLL